MPFNRWASVSIWDRIASHFTVGDDCWEWCGPMNPSGYGNQVTFEGRTQLPHRVLYQLLVGPIPDGFEIDHLCRNRKCVRPDHLEPVTHAENQRRGHHPWTMKRYATHCKRGHLFDEKNTHVRKSGARECRRCMADRQNERYRRLREASE